jgi:hypothetical protein
VFKIVLTKIITPILELPKEVETKIISSFYKRTRFRSLEDVPLHISHDINHQEFKGKIFNGFKQLGLTYTHQGLKETLRSALPKKDNSTYWLDTSFMIQGESVMGYHPKNGVFGIYRNSFLNACYWGLLSLPKDEKSKRSYREMKKEVYDSRNLFNLWIMHAVKQENVLVAPEVESTLDQGLYLLATLCGSRKSRGQKQYAKLFERDFWFRSKLLEAIEKNQEEIPKDLSNNEIKIRRNLEEISSENEDLISSVESSFISRVIARAQSTGVTQTLLTRDTGIFNLLKIVDLPDYKMVWDYYQPLHLRKIKISPN